MKIVAFVNAILILAFDAYLYFDFMDVIVVYKIIGRYKKIFYMLASLSAAFMVKSLVNPIIGLLVIPLIYFGAGFLFFESELKDRIKYYLIFFVVVSVSEMAFMLSLGAIFRMRNIKITNSYYDILLVILLMKMIVLIVIKILKIFMFYRKYGISRTPSLCFLLLPCSTVLVYGAILSMSVRMNIQNTVRPMLELGCVGMLLSNTILFYIFKRLTNAMDKAKKLELEQMKENLYQKYYEKLDEKNKVHGQIIHSMNSYFETIGRLAKDNQDDKILKILEEIDIKLESAESTSYSTNVILNAILTEKRLQAKLLDIAFEIFVEPGVNLNFVAEIDLISLLGNLINNAIEAAQDSHQKYICLQIYSNETNNYVILKLENSFLKVPEKKGTVFETSKSNKELHGIGLEHVKKIIQQYDGYLDIKIEDNIFKVSAIL